MNLPSWWPTTRAIDAITKSLARLEAQGKTMAESQADVSAKLDKLSTDAAAAFTRIGALVADLKAQIAALQGQSAPDLTPLGDKVDAIDTAVQTAAAAFGPAPTTP